MDRPLEISWFERIIFGTLVLGAIQSWIAWRPLAELTSPASLITTQILTFAVIGGLTLLIFRRRSNVAKWISVVMGLLGLPFAIWLAATGKMQGSALISVVQTVGQLAAYALLFTRSSRAWFKGSPDLKAVFD